MVSGRATQKTNPKQTADCSAKSWLVRIQNTLCFETWPEHTSSSRLMEQSMQVYAMRLHGVHEKPETHVAFTCLSAGAMPWLRNYSKVRGLYFGGGRGVCVHVWDGGGEVCGGREGLGGRGTGLSCYYFLPLIISVPPRLNKLWSGCSSTLFNFTPSLNSSWSQNISIAVDQVCLKKCVRR